MMGFTRTRRILTMVAISALGLGAVGVAEAGKVKRVKTKLAKTKIGPDGASGKVKSKNKACVKGRKVTLRGPKPFNPGAGRGAAVAGGKVKIGIELTNARGRWTFSPSSDISLIAGVYEVSVPGKRVGAKRLLCLPRRFVAKA